MSESRLFRIIYYLIDKGRATAAELAIRFSPQAAFRVYDEFPASPIERQTDGSFIVTVVHGAAEEWLKGYILGFGAQAEVLEPKYFREQIGAEARKIFEKCDTGCHGLNGNLELQNTGRENYGF